MSKYIDVKKLIALIDAKLEDLGMSGSVWVGRSVLNELKDDIESLQQEQPKVDLEEEITKWIDSGDITDTRFADYDDSDIERTARYFYELGCKARE